MMEKYLVEWASVLYSTIVNSVVNTLPCDTVWKGIDWSTHLPLNKMAKLWNFNAISSMKIV